MELICSRLNVIDRLTLTSSFAANTHSINSYWECVCVCRVHSLESQTIERSENKNGIILILTIYA